MDLTVELSLDCKPHSYCSFMQLKSFGDQTEQTQKLEDFFARLEEERLKIDAFKRELPLCMQLLTNALEASRQQLQTYQANQGPTPVLEEFIPLKPSSFEESKKAPNKSEKESWMTTAQLWSQSNDRNNQQAPLVTPKETDDGFTMSPKLALDGKQRNGGAFLPFSKEMNICASPSLRVLPDLALATAGKEMGDKKYAESDNGSSCSRESLSKGDSGGTMTEQEKGEANPAEMQVTTINQTHRKARRCWSPDLHRSFVNALHKLGGSQVATPKQIKELMKVEGLTNDEVKSHLQKYRLHTRRLGPSSHPAGTPPPQLVVLGGFWVPPEYSMSHTGAPAIYGAHSATHASTHYCAPPHQLHHGLHQQYYVYKTSSQTNSSPESDGRQAKDGSESMEDGKSESNNWKEDSGENGRIEEGGGLSERGRRGEQWKLS